MEVFLKGLNFERVSQQFIKSHVPVLSYKLEGWKALVAQRILVHSLDSFFYTGNTWSWVVHTNRVDGNVQRKAQHLIES